MDIQLRVRRPCLLGGKPVDAGSLVAVPIAEAAVAVDGGRVELANEADRAALDLHRRAESVRAVGRTGRRDERGFWLKAGRVA